ncbi:MAG: S8 family serine peptidase [Zavarzinella sp.]
MPLFEGEQRGFAWVLHVDGVPAVGIAWPIEASETIDTSRLSYFSWPMKVEPLPPEQTAGFIFIDADGPGMYGRISINADGPGMNGRISIDADGPGMYGRIHIDADSPGMLGSIHIDADGPGMLGRIRIYADGPGMYGRIHIDADGPGMHGSILIRLVTEVAKRLSGKGDVRFSWWTGEVKYRPSQTSFDRDKVVKTISSLSPEALHAVCEAFPEASLPSRSESTSDTIAEKFVTWAESTAPGLEFHIVRAHQVDPLQGLLQKVIPNVSRIDAALTSFFDASEAPTGQESTAKELPKPRPISMLVAVDDDKVQLADIPDFKTVSRIGRIIAGVGSPRSILALEHYSGVISVEASPSFANPECVNSFSFIKADTIHQRYNERGDGAIVAIIDVGIDVLHEAFRDDRGQTRILAVWDQRDNTGRPPSGQTFGTLHTQNQIDEYINTNTVPGNLIIRNQCHGTHVASIAAGSTFGNNAFPGGMAPEAKLVIVIVANPQPGQDEPASIGYSVAHCAALTFIRDVAREKGLPVVVNVSLGAQAGAHDGRSLLELAFDEFSGNGQTPGFAIVKSAGNDRASCLHATVPVNSMSVSHLQWLSPKKCSQRPMARRQDVIDLWLPALAKLQFSLIDPAGQSSPFVSWSNSYETGTFPGGNTYRLTYTRFHKDNGLSRLYITIEHGTSPVILEGTWKLRCEAQHLHACIYIDAWIDRTDSQLVSFLNHVEEQRTLSIPGTAATVISVGAVTTTIPIANPAFSAYGPTLDGRHKPEVAAPGVSIPAASSRSVSAMHAESGTSMAAPHVAGAIALLFSQRGKGNGQQVNAAQIRSALQTSTMHCNGSWHPGTGYGVMDTEQFLQAFGLTCPANSSTATSPAQNPVSTGSES